MFPTVHAFWSRASAVALKPTHARGLLRLYLLQFRDQVKYFEKNLPGLTPMAMAFMPLGSREDHQPTPRRRGA